MKYNKIYKPKKFDKFTIIPSYIFRHKDISIGATGLYTWLFSHASTQEMTVEFISGHFKEGKDAIRSKLKELIKEGYLIRKQVTDKGKFKGYNYYLNDKPHKEKPKTDLSAPVNPPQSNTNTNIYIKSNIKQNANIDKSFEHFVSLFDFKYQPKTATQIINWKICLDKCVSIDNYDLKEIYLAVKFIRNDDFWREHFLSLLKLRNLDKNGILFIHRFMELYKKQNKPKCYKKIKGIKEYIIYLDPDGSKKLGAITKTNKLNEFNLSQFLDKSEIKQLKNFVNGNR
tara:strand:+ start:1617 stop:2471 length:855 start_codon:yes stop_codon:yes gene_type:complete